MPNLQDYMVILAASLMPKSDQDALQTRLQHHGAPTNLIDFTNCPYIALYFVCRPPFAVQEGGRNSGAERRRLLEGHWGAALPTGRLMTLSL